MLSWFRRRSSPGPQTAAAADALPPQLANELRRERLAQHAQSLAVCSMIATSFLLVVSAYLSLVGTRDCRVVSVPDRGPPHEVCTESIWHPLSVVKRFEVTRRTDTGNNHGTRSEWFRSGDLSIQGDYSDGQKVGAWHEWWSNGNLRYEGIYVAGVRQGRETWWFQSGLPEWTGKYNERGFRHGEEIWWHDNGAVRRIGRLNNGEKDGAFTVWAPDGTHAFSVVHGDDDTEG